MKISGTAVGGLLSVVAQTPGFLLNRIGLLLLGVQALFIPGSPSSQWELPCRLQRCHL